LISHSLLVLLSYFSVDTPYIVYSLFAYYTSTLLNDEVSLFAKKNHHDLAKLF